MTDGRGKANGLETEQMFGGEKSEVRVFQAGAEKVESEKQAKADSRRQAQMVMEENKHERKTIY